MKRVLLSLSIVLTITLTAQQKTPVAFYLTNLPTQRIGQMSDAAIKDSLTNLGFLVIEVDCKNYPTTSPELEDYLVQFHKTTPALLASYNTDLIEPDLDAIFYIPEGYLIQKGVPVWNIREHGADGSIERIMSTYNSVIVPKYGVPAVTQAEDMIDQYGNPLDYNLRIDIIYPSGNTVQDVPLLLNFSSNSPRQVPFNPTKTNEVIYRSIFPLGFLTTGYAWANADHCYNPLARGEVWGYFDQYTLEDWNGLATVTAYIRYLNAHASLYNLNGKIGCMGISKASYSAMRIANLKNAEGKEYFRFNGIENAKPQPWLGYPSTVDVVYSAAGNGTRRATTYADEYTVPIISSAGLKDEYNQWDVFPEVVKRYNDKDIIHLSLWMEELGHTYPGLGTDLTTGLDRYPLCKAFFDNYLKPTSTQTPLEPYYILPKEAATEVDVYGNTRILVRDNILPPAMLGVSPYAPITVRFLSEIEVSEASAHIKVIHQSSNQEVVGQWVAKMKSTSFEFTPTMAMEIGETYIIKVLPGLSNSNGQMVTSEFIRSFVVSATGTPPVETATNIVPASEDSYTQVSLNTVSKGGEDRLRTRYSSGGDWRFDIYLKFDVSSLSSANIHNAKVKLSSSTILAGDPIVLKMYGCTNNWSESTLVSSNRPTIATAVTLDQFIYTGDDTWTVFDVTSYIKSQLEANQTEVSLCIRSTTTSNTESVYFASKESSQESLRPYLAIEEKIPTSNQLVNNTSLTVFNHQLVGCVEKSCSLQLWNMFGQMAFSKALQPGTVAEDLSDLDKGLYVLSIPELNFTQKIQL